MTLNIDGKVEGKLTFAFKNDVRNQANFHQSTSKSQNWDLCDSFIQSRKFMSLKFTGEFFVIAMKKDSKLQDELTCRFKIDMKTLMNFDTSTQKSQKFSL